jgi:Arc/MetJ family transcription regulator
MTAHTPRARQIVHANSVSRTKIEIDDQLIRKVRKLTRLKTKREIVHDALDELVKTEERKAILRYFGSGIWMGDLKALRRSRV